MDQVGWPHKLFLKQDESHEISESCYRDTETETERDRDRDRQTDRQTDRELA